MKKILVALFSIMILLGTATTTLADKNVKAQVVIDGKSMILNTANVSLDGKKLKSDVPAINYEGRVLIPIRFVAEELGAKVDWDAKTETATIKTPDKVIEVKINSSKITINGKQKDLLDKVPAKLMSTSTSKSNRTMVPLRSVLEELGAEVSWENETNTAIVKSKKNNTDTTVKPEAVKSNKIKSITTKNITTSKIPQIHIETESEIKYKNMSLENSTDIVIDIEDSVVGSVTNPSINNDAVSSVKMVQLSNAENKKTVRVTVSLKKGIDYEILKDKNILKINFVNKIQGIERETINGKEAIVIKNAYASKTNSFSLSNPNRLVVDLRNTNLTNVGSQISTDIVKGLRTSQYKGPEYDVTEQVSRVVLDISEDYENPKFTTQERGNDIIVYVEGTKKAPVVTPPTPPVVKPPTPPVVTPPTPPTPEPGGSSKQKLIVIDAGHGGSDPGSISSSKQNKEKDLTLSFALETERKLKNLGYKVHMIRSTDTFVSLDDRSAKANALNADVFLSIHFNAFSNASATGIETFYTAKDGQDRAGFAGAIQSELIKTLGVVDRGVKTANFSVTRKTNMVSALTELGFITNPNDEKKIMTDEYKDKATTAIANGIHKFLSK